MPSFFFKKPDIRSVRPDFCDPGNDNELISLLTILDEVLVTSPIAGGFIKFSNEETDGTFGVGTCAWQTAQTAQNKKAITMFFILFF
jgi:hypothetical protein